MATSIAAVIAATATAIIAALVAATAPPPSATPRAIARILPRALARARSPRVLANRSWRTIAVDLIEHLVAVFERRGVGAIPQEISLLVPVGCITELLPGLLRATRVLVVGSSTLARGRHPRGL
jgi:hypothetical protein